MKAKLSMLAIFLIFGALSPLRAHELITTRILWTQHISRIFYKRCISCHRQGGSSFPLTTYQEARPWAKAIKYEVLKRRMPPWPAVKGFGAFRNDISLSEREIALISSWVEGGAPEGRRIFLPPLPPEETFAESPPLPSQSLSVQGSFTIGEAVAAVGIRAEDLPEGGSLEVVVHFPSGKTEYVIWLRDYQPRWQRSYYFRDPISLPAGTELFIHPAGVEASLLIATPSQEP